MKEDSNRRSRKAFNLVDLAIYRNEQLGTIITQTTGNEGGIILWIVMILSMQIWRWWSVCRVAMVQKALIRSMFGIFMPNLQCLYNDTRAKKTVFISKLSHWQYKSHSQKGVKHHRSEKDNKRNNIFPQMHPYPSSPQILEHSPVPILMADSTPTKMQKVDHSFGPIFQ